MLGDLQDVTGDGVMADPADVAAVTPVRGDVNRQDYRHGYQSFVVIKPGVLILSRVSPYEIRERVNRLLGGSGQ